MKRARELSNAIKKLTGGNDYQLAKVLSVDKVNNTCEVEIDGDEFGGVRLQAVVDSGKKGNRYYPSEGSDVLIGKLDDSGAWAVFFYSTLEEHVVEVESTSYKLNKGGHEIKKGSDTLWEGLKLFIESMEKIVVTQGTNYDPVKLSQAKTKLKNILNGT